MRIMVANRFKVCSKLGTGAFGVLYQGEDVRSNEEVAIKLERSGRHDDQLLYEAKVYQKLKGVEGICNVHWVGAEGQYNAMVMDILGPTLQDLFAFCNESFSAPTFSQIAIQMIQRTESLHQRGYVHRDLKPENFLIGTGKKSKTLYLIDFGLAKRYINPKTGDHIQMKRKPNPTGTMRYCSASAQSGFEQSRKDDLISLAHMFIYFACQGQLPWTSEASEKKQISMKSKLDVHSLL